MGEIWRLKNPFSLYFPPDLKYVARYLAYRLLKLIYSSGTSNIMKPTINIPTLSLPVPFDQNIGNVDSAPQSLFNFILTRKGNRNLLFTALLVTILQFVIFKTFYPFPDFFSDSYSYIYAAYARLDLNIWPIGYSKFLLLFHLITHSSYALIFFQYLFLEVSALYFFFSIIYLYHPAKQLKIALFVFLFVNPLFLYLSNYVNSDPLFASLSLLWFTELLWILYRPKVYHIFVQAILLFLCFTVRNNAYYYPIISLLVFTISKQSWKHKLVGILMPFIFIIPFVIHTRHVAYEMTGRRQFSLFTGWQLANNALYMRGHIQVDTNKLPTPETRMLDRMASNYFSLLNPGFDDYLTGYVANYFIRQPNAPLKHFFFWNYKPKDDYGVIVAWGKASAVFDDYGSALIKSNPIPFFKYFILRNTRNYFLPPLEKLEIYNLGDDKVDPIAQFWFDYNSNKVTSVSKELQGKILYLYPLFFMFINIYFIANAIWWLVSKKKKQISIFSRQSLLIAGGFVLINIAFSILATMNVFRYQVVPMIICLAFTLAFTEISGRKAVTFQTVKENV